MNSVRRFPVLCFQATEAGTCCTVSWLPAVRIASNFFVIIRNSSANKNDTTTGFGLHGISVEVFRRLHKMAPDTCPHCLNPSLNSFDHGHGHVSRTGTLKSLHRKMQKRKLTDGSWAYPKGYKRSGYKRIYIPPKLAVTVDAEYVATLVNVNM